MKDMEKIRFGNLSWPLKVAVIAAWAELIYLTLMFGLGFIIGMIGTA